jgi:sugar-specific transcriptional regulator TrmB
MNHQLLEQLQFLGFNENEAKIYMATLEMGRGTVTQISQLAGLNRTTGYDILERLGIQGICTRSRVGKKRIYVAEPPSHLQQYLRDKKQVAQRKLEKLKEIFPDLQNLYSSELKPLIKFAEGRTAIENIYSHQLNAKSEIYSILELKGYAENYDEMGKKTSLERYKRGIKQKVIAQKNSEALAWYEKVYKDKKNLQKFTEYRWMNPQPKRSPAAEILIFDNKVSGLLAKPGENAAFEIQSQSFADSLKGIFELAWERAQIR